MISGLAWSGRGKVKRVDISLDGGRNWRTARIDGPVFDRACVRFYAEIDWNGEPLLLQSRAMDETGYVQPTKAALRKIRGVNSIYHNNGIQPGRSGRTGRSKMSKWARLALPVLLLLAAPALAQNKRYTPPNPPFARGGEDNEIGMKSAASARPTFHQPSVRRNPSGG